MARRNLVLTLSLLSVLTATAGCAEMGKVRVAGSSVDPNAPVNVAPNINCSDISDVLTGRMPPLQPQKLINSHWKSVAPPGPAG